jgi:hypothetical protein
VFKIALFCQLVFLPPGFFDSPSKFDACLPEGIKATDIVSAQRIGPTGKIKTVSVEDTLVSVKARCRRGKLVDESGKEIYFFRMTGCWGNPPPDYVDILQRQNEQLEKLRKRYTVIQITCNQTGLSVH